MKKVLNKARNYILANYRKELANSPYASYGYYELFSIGDDIFIMSRKGYNDLYRQIAKEKGDLS
jgi:hypothetical protein